jgi:Ran-binding protein 1
MSDNEEDNAPIADVEEEVKGNWEVKVNLPEIKKVTGEEEEECIYKAKSKLFRFKDGQWKERCNGDFKLLRHKANHKVRSLMRQEKTLTIMANHFILDGGYCDLKQMATSDKAFTWLALDCSDGTPENSKLALRFATAEMANQFKKAFDDARVFNQLVKAGKTKELVFAPVVVEEAKAEPKKEEPKKESKEQPVKESPIPVKKEEPKKEEPKKE